MRVYTKIDIKRQVGLLVVLEVRRDSNVSASHLPVTKNPLIADLQRFNKAPKMKLLYCGQSAMTLLGRQESVTGKPRTTPFSSEAAIAPLVKFQPIGLTAKMRTKR